MVKQSPPREILLAYRTCHKVAVTDCHRLSYVATVNLSVFRYSAIPSDQKSNGATVNLFRPISV